MSCSSCSSNPCRCGMSSHLVTPIGGTTFCNSAEACANEPSHVDLLEWERLISAIPEDDQGTPLKFFVAKYNLVLTKFSGEVENEAVTAHLRIGGTFHSELIISGEALKDNYYASNALSKAVTKGQLVEIYIDDAGGSGSTARNLSIELQGYEGTL